LGISRGIIIIIVINFLFITLKYNVNPEFGDKIKLPNLLLPWKGNPHHAELERVVFGRVRPGQASPRAPLDREIGILLTCGI